jgi:hypothetical protein
MACSGFFHFVAHDWKTRVKSLSDHPSYREHTQDAARTWKSMSNIEQAYWDAQSANTDGCREKVRLKSMSEAEKKAHDCKLCMERCSELRQKSEDLKRKADRLEHRAEHGKRPLSPYFAFVAQHRHEYKGSPVAQAKALGERWRGMSDEEKSAYMSTEYKTWKEEHGGGSLSSKLKRIKKSANISKRDE